jgi:hypothetical protein
VMTPPLSTQPSPRIAALLDKMRRNQPRLIFALDATASREATWDMAMQLQAQMFEEAAKVSGLDVSLLYYRGHDEVKQSRWFSDAHELIGQMGTIRCAAGATKIAKLLRHIKAEHAREKVAAAVFIGDAVEERPSELYDVAADLGVPMFMFQEGNGEVVYLDQRGELAGEYPPTKVETVFREIARLSGGAYGRFDAGSARQLGEMLRAVAAFAVGGIAALTNQNTDSARKLLGQMK